MRSRVSLLAPTLAALAAVILCPALAAQDDAPVDFFGEQISVEVVNLQVWVRDRDGRPITDLDRDDFVLLRDGQPIDIINFAAYSDAAGGPAERPRQETESSTDDRNGGASAVPVAPWARSDVVHAAILIDNWNLKPEDRARVFKGIRRFLDEHVRPADRVALFVNDRSLHLVQGFTDDRAELTDTLSRLERIAPAATNLPAERRDAVDTIARTFLGYWDNNYLSDVACEISAGWGDMANAARHYAEVVQAHGRTSAGALATAAHVLAGLPGQRVLLYIGSGLPQTPGLEVFEIVSKLCPARQSDLAYFQNDYDQSWLYQEVAARANAAGVTVFALDADDPAEELTLDAGFPGGSAISNASGGVKIGPNFRVPLASQRLLDQDMEAPLVVLAYETGGQAFLNASDFGPDLGRFARDLRNYYSLGFRPMSPADGDLHRLEVQVVRDGGYRVRHRRAYQDKPQDERIAERLRGVSRFGGEVNPLDVRVEVGRPFEALSSFQTLVRLWVPLSRLDLVPDEATSTLRGRLQILLSVSEPDGEPGPMRQKLVSVSAKASTGEVTGSQLVEVAMDVPPGSHQLALAVRDAVGGQTTYLAQDIQVPAGASVATALED